MHGTRVPGGNCENDGVIPEPTNILRPDLMRFCLEPTLREGGELLRHVVNDAFFGAVYRAPMPTDTNKATVVRLEEGSALGFVLGNTVSTYAPTMNPHCLPRPIPASYKIPLRLVLDSTKL